MKEKTLISIVTPVYNGMPFIQKAYECLCRQTYSNWEWAVVNDGSTDDTGRLLRQLADADRRINYTRQPGSGTAKQPRDRAVFQSHGELIVPFDIDDAIEPDYLRRMLERMEETDADIVYPQMRFVDMNTGVVTLTLPVADFDATRVYEGRQLVRETMPEWRIGCNGGLYKRHVWVNMSWLEEHDPLWMNSDEIDERLYQLKARSVAFAKAQYYYQNHPTSTTTRISPKRFHELKTCLQLVDITEHEFGTDSEEHRLARRKAFLTWRNMMALYAQCHEQFSGADGLILKNLRHVFDHLDVSSLTLAERIRFIYLSSYPLLFALFCLKYSPRLLVEKFMQRYCPKRYLWNVLRPRIEQLTRQQASQSYNEEKRLAKPQPYAISMFCGNVAGGGLVDRLRGAISVFMVCREQQHPYRLYFTHPFRLTDYLEPNTYDWRISEGEVSMATSQSVMVIADTQADTPREHSYHRQLFAQELSAHQHQQTHFYTNASFCYDEDFAQAFHELFKPTKRLRRHIDEVKAKIGQKYITVSARFCNAFDDFNEEVYNEPLPHDERKQLLSACMERLEALHRKHPQHTIVVCADSETFLTQMQALPYADTVPGTISHIGNDTKRDYDYYEKTFLDFYIISEAEKAYLLHSEHMHNSGFPYAAARMGGRPFEVVEF